MSRRIRVICSDPYATDYSSDEDKEDQNTPKRIVYQIDLDPTRPQPEMTRTRRPDPTRIPKCPYPGVYLRPSGKWTSEIRERVTRTRFYLGTFDSPEAAFRAYCAKKQELVEKFNLTKKRKACSVDDMDSDCKLGTMKRAKSGKWAAPTQVPVRRTRLREGRKGKAAFGDVSACKSDNCSGGPKKRREKTKTRLTQKFENGVTKLPVMVETFGSEEADCGEKSGPGGCQGRSASDSNFANMIKCGLLNFKAVVQQTTGFHEKSGVEEKAAFEEVKDVDFGCCSIPKEMASLILDENGFLLGEFSQIDDLSICVDDG